MKEISKRKYIIILIMIVVVGLLFRIFDIDKQSLWIDEGYTLNGALAITEHGYPRLDSGELYVNNILATYTTAAIIKTGLFDPFSPWAARIPFAVFGTLLIVAVFYLAKTTFQSLEISIFTAFITAFSYWEIAWSRQIRGYAACAVFVTLALVFLWRFVKFRKILDVVYALVLTVIAGLFHLAGFALLPVVLSLVVIKVFNFKKPLYLYLLCGVSIVQMVLCFVLIDNTLLKIANLFSSIDPVFLIGFGIAVSVGLFIKESRERTGFFGLVLLNLASSIILFSPTIYSRYVFVLMPILILLFCSGAVYSLQLLPKSSPLKYSAVIVAALLLIFNSIQWYPQSFYNLEKDSPQPDFAKVFSIIKSLKKDDDVIISIYPVMSNIYLGEKGMSLDRDIKNSNLLKSDRSGSSEYYVGAPLIKDAFELKDIIDKQHGFVISERLFEQVIGGRISAIENSQKSSLIYQSFEIGESGEDHINLYRF